MDERSGSSFAPLQLVLSNASSLTSRLSEINETIPARVRSLLASRHERHPPRVPLPSPDAAYLARNPEQGKGDYFTLNNDLEKRLSVLEPPERKYRLINTRFDGSEDSGIAPGYLTKEHLWKQEKPQLDPRELIKGLNSYKTTRHIPSDGSDHVNECGLHGQQRPPTPKKADAQKPEEKPKVEKLLPRMTGFFQREVVPWEYHRPSPTGSTNESRRPSDPTDHETQPEKVDADSRTAPPSKKLILNVLPSSFGKITRSGMQRSNGNESRPRILGVPAGSSSNLPVPPVLTPAGEHLHDHGEQPATEPVSNNRPKKQEPSNPIAEEILNRRMRHDQRLRGHDDLRGYSRSAEDSLHTLAAKTPLLRTPPTEKKPEELSQEERRQLFQSKMPAIKADEIEHSSGQDLPAEESRLPLSFKASNISVKEPNAANDHGAVEPEFNNPLCRMRASSSGSPFGHTEVGRQWIARLLSHDKALDYQSQLTERPRRRTVHATKQVTHDGSMSDPGQLSDSAAPQQRDPESINKVVMDLELLLREALRVAKEAAEIDQLPDDHERISRITVPSDRRRSMAPTSKVLFEESDEEEPSLSQLRKERQNTPWPRESRRTSLAILPPQVEVSSESSSPSDKVETPPKQGQEAGHDWAYPSAQTSRRPTMPDSAAKPLKGQIGQLQRQKTTVQDTPPKSNRRPSIQPRFSSLRLQAPLQKSSRRPSRATRSEMTSDPLFSSAEDDDVDVIRLGDPEKQGGVREPRPWIHPRQSSRRDHIKSHLQGFKGEEHQEGGNRSARRQPIARNWHTSRKRIAAGVACLNTALLGVLIGIYAGEVPAIQYAIVDLHHYAVLGNVFFYIGLAIPTLLCWPLPLLHGRKPYTLAALAILLPLQLPQGIAVGNPLSPRIAGYRAMLLVTRGLSGLAMGFANINFQTTLLDLFGASLQSANPHQEVVSEHDIRRHGGGMGVWLGIWSWCSIGSIAVGFFIGTGIITNLAVSWGFWIALILTISILVLNLLTPEVRRSKHRRTLAEVWSGSRREKIVQTGEITIHLHSIGAVSWVDELRSGLELSLKMLKQPGFLVLCVYTAWVYGQIVLIVVLLGALISRDYRYKPPFVGLSVFAIALGALIAVPFQLGSVFSRSRTHIQRTDSMTFEKRATRSSHLIRRATFMTLLPLADLAFTLSSVGPPLHSAVPTVFAAAIGFLSNMAMAECYGLIMETFDTSDLQAGMIGRPRRRSVTDDIKKLRTPFTSYPRISAAFALCQGFGFLIAAAATGTGGALARRLGDQTAIAVVAAILLLLTIFLTGALWRFKTVAVIPGQIQRAGTDWEAVVIGQPSGKTRRMSLLELGKQSRWTEIRRRNRMTFSE